jgi:hypothetical protein
MRGTPIEIDVRKNATAPHLAPMRDKHCLAVPAEIVKTYT